jgi:peptidoglycan/LPS O-acetylase OafA/YrhL
MTQTLVALPQPAQVQPKTFRADIEGLRAVSIIGVVLFHAKVPHLAGGFVGVDVFFVISGFLITGQLVRDAEQRGRIRLGSFYARRAKRLLPPAAIVIAATAVVALFSAPLLRVFTACFDLLWSIFYIGNWRFINQGNDYLAGTSDYNVALHFWSLAVEEQFYVVWPALVIVSLWVARRRAYPVRTVVCCVMAALSVASFAVGVWLTSADPGLAYMATYTRAWQFGAGALLAVAAPRGLQFRYSWLLGWVGLVAIVCAVVQFNGTVPYPGWAALVPTLGAAAVIAAPSLSLERVLSTPIVALIGRWSYSWYLWHWPILVLVEARFGRTGRDRTTARRLDSCARREAHPIVKRAATPDFRSGGGRRHRDRRSDRRRPAGGHPRRQRTGVRRSIDDDFGQFRRSLRPEHRQEFGQRHPATDQGAHGRPRTPGMPA